MICLLGGGVLQWCSVTLRAWSEGELGDVGLQDLRQRRPQLGGADRPARRPNPYEQLLRHPRPQDEPQLRLQLHRVVL